MNAWEMPQVQALGEERLRLMQEAAEKCRGKSGMERLDIFLEYGENPKGDSLRHRSRRHCLRRWRQACPNRSKGS